MLHTKVYVVVLWSVTYMAVTMKLDIQPNIDLPIREADPFNITCKLSGSSINHQLLQVMRCFTNQTCHALPNTATNMENTTDGNGTEIWTRIYSKPQSIMGDTGVYTCGYGSTMRSDYPTIYVVPVPKLPSNFSCFSFDKSGLKCTWIEPSMIENRNYTTSYQSLYRYGDSYDIKPCPKKIPQGCHWPNATETNDTSIIFDYTQREIDVFIRAENFRFQINQTHTVNISNVVKLSSMPLKCVHKTSRVITLEWNLPERFEFHSLERTFDVIFYLSSNWNDKSEKHIGTKEKSSLIHTFTNLIPYTEYKIKMQAKPETSLLWSDNSTIVVKTDPAVPGALPEVLSSSFFSCSDDGRYQQNGKVICLLLKSIPEESVNSFYANYSIKITAGNDVYIKNVSHAEVTVPILKEPFRRVNEIIVEVGTYNDVGFYTNHSTASFPGYTAGLPAPRLVIVHVDILGNYDVSWIIDDFDKDIIDEAIVYWCKEENNNGVCKSDLNWKTVPGNTTLAKDIVRDVQKSGWIFAVGFTDKTKRSGGLVFAEENCVYFQSRPGTQRSPDFMLDSLQNDTTSLMITFDLFTYCHFKDFPKQYTIYYLQQVSEDIRPNCTTVKSNGNSEITKATLDRRYFFIENLKYGTYYAVCMSLLLIDNSTTADSDVLIKRTSPLAEFSAKGDSDSNLTLWIIIGCISGIIFIVIFIVAVYCCKRRYDLTDASISMPKLKRPYEQIRNGVETDDANGGFDDFQPIPVEKEKYITLYEKIKDDSGHDSSLQSQATTDHDSLQRSDSSGSDSSRAVDSTKQHIDNAERDGADVNVNHQISASVSTTNRQSSDEGFEDGPESLHSSKSQTLSYSPFHKSFNDCFHLDTCHTKATSEVHTTSSEMNTFSTSENDQMVTKDYSSPKEPDYCDVSFASSISEVISSDASSNPEAYQHFSGLDSSSGNVDSYMKVNIESSCSPCSHSTSSSV